MKLYTGRVRLNGEIKNEVPKSDLTASEIMVLKFIHGRSENASDPVVGIKETGAVQRSDAQERARLESIYTNFQGQSGRSLVHSILGVPGVPLPQEYVAETAAFDVEEFEAENDQHEVIEPAPAPVVRKRIKTEAAEEAAA